MAGELVLITGANGALGYPVVLHALRAGFRVRAVVRSQAKADSIVKAPSVAALDAATKAKLTFAIVPDLLQEGAYNEALQGATYAIHVASPIPSNDNSLKPEEIEAAIITPAIKGTINMLEAAERTPSIRRVVITSSVVAQLPASEFAGAAPTGNVFSETSRAPDPEGPFTDEGTAYRASKVLALNETERWLKARPERHFSVVHVHPVIILGRIELATSEEAMLQGTSGRALASMLNKGAPGGMLSNIVWVEDVAEVHVRALNERRIPDGQSLIAQISNRDGVVWADGERIVQKKFPKAVKKGILPNNGWPRTKVLSFDVSETERLVGMKCTGFERPIEDIAEQYLDLVGAEKA